MSDQIILWMLRFTSCWLSYCFTGSGKEDYSEKDPTFFSIKAHCNARQGFPPLLLVYLVHQKTFDGMEAAFKQEIKKLEIIIAQKKITK